MFSQRFVLFCYKINPKIPLFFLPLNPAFSVAPSNLVAVAALHYGGLQASKVKGVFTHLACRAPCFVYFKDSRFY